MKKIILALVIILSCNFSFSQNTNEKISISFNNKTLSEALKAIEASTSYKFYFDPVWVDSNKTLISQSYTNVTVDELLDKLLSKTDLNFIVLKNKVILTLNQTIHETLPSGFFTDAPADIVSKNNNPDNPVFYQQYDSLSTYSVK